MTTITLPESILFIATTGIIAIGFYVLGRYDKRRNGK